MFYQLVFFLHEHRERPGTRATAQSTTSLPRWTFPTSTELGKPQAFGSGKARDGREGERQRPGECPGNTRGQTARGASVSRRAGQHDDAEKAGTTPGDAKAGKAAGPIPFSDSRLASSDGWRKWNRKSSSCTSRKGHSHVIESAIPR